MNERELLRHQIKVMTGFKNGEEVQLQSRDDPKSWYSDSTPNWNWALDVWRLRPVPRECWVNEYANELGHSYPTRERADKAAHGNRTDCIHMREVVSDSE